MSRTVSTWSCPDCGTAAFSEQNFCRRCGRPRPARASAPITAQIPAVGTGPEPPIGPQQKRSMSRLGLLFVALLFVVLGGFAALLVDDIRADEPSTPTPSTSTTPARSNRGGGQVTTTTG